VLSYGASTKPFTGTGTTYSTTLRNQCALVRFDLENQGDYEVTLSGVPTQATVDFENNAITPNTSTTGNITLYGEEGNTMYRWAILLPGTNLSTEQHSDLTITYSGEADLTNLDNNNYINGGISINNPLPLPAAPDAQYAVKTSGDELTQFSVSANKKVYFSKANLRYNESSGVWSFHDNQIDGCFGYVTGSYPQGYNVSPNGSEMDRFCWGLHSPTTTGESDYVDGSRNLDVNDGTDWGCAFKAEGYNEGTNWRTLTAAEWNYLLNNANRGSNRFMKGSFGPHNITDPNTNATYYVLITGLFIAPDNFDPSQYSFTSGFANKKWNNANSQNIININDANTLLAAGFVFLPALGYRDENGYQDYYPYSQATNYSFVGYYWSATGVQQNPGLTPQAEALQFDYYENTMPSNNAEFRNLGMCVRLVWDAN
jgi:hypothetical protein